MLLSQCLKTSPSQIISQYLIRHPAGIRVPVVSPVVFVSRLFAQLHDRRLSVRQCVPRNSGPLEDQPEQTQPPTTAAGAGIFPRCHVCQRDRPSDKGKQSAAGSAAILFARHSHRHVFVYTPDFSHNPAVRNQTFCCTD